MRHKAIEVLNSERLHRVVWAGALFCMGWATGLFWAASKGLCFR